MSFFDAFYFMSYTATTIGFGELPYPFTAGAAAVGHLLDLPDGDRLGVRHRLAADPAAGPGVPAGPGPAAVHPQGPAPARAVPAARRLRPDRGAARPRTSTRSASSSSSSTSRSDRIDALDLGAYHADIPGLVADAANPHHLAVAGLDHPYCAGRAGADQRRRGQPRRHHDRRAAAARAAGHRPDRLAADRRPDAGLRHPDGGQPVRPVRRPPAAGAPGARVLPAADLAGGGSRAPSCPTAASRRPTGAGWCAATAGSAARSPPTCGPRAWR